MRKLLSFLSLVSLFATITMVGSIYWVLKQDPVLRHQIHSEFVEDVIQVREFSGVVLNPDFAQVCARRDQMGYACFFNVYLSEFSHLPYGLGGLALLAAVGMKFIVDERPVNSARAIKEKAFHWLGFLRLQVGAATSRSKALPVLVDRVQSYLAFFPGIAQRCRWGYESLRVPASHSDLDEQAKALNQVITSSDQQ